MLVIEFHRRNGQQFLQGLASSKLSTVLDDHFRSFYDIFRVRVTDLRSFAPQKHRVDGFGQFGTAGLVDAYRNPSRDAREQQPSISANPTLSLVISVTTSRYVTSSLPQV